MATQADFVLLGAHGPQTELAVLSTPEEYQLRPRPSLDASVEDLVALYLVHARDKTSGTSDAPTFADAVALQKILDQVTSSSVRFA